MSNVCVIVAEPVLPALLCSCGNQLQKILEFPHLLQQVGTPWGMFACCLHVFVCAMVTR